MSCLSLSILSLLLATQTASQQYELIKTYTPHNFFDEFDFFSGQDPTGGFVQYEPRETASVLGLTKNSSDVIYLGVDHTTTYPTTGPGRPSTRVQSKLTFTEGLFVLDLSHIPVGCGVWPAFWSTGLGDWPNDGEIDIIENVNDAIYNNAALHAAGDCSVSGTVTQTGDRRSIDCNIAHDGNQGCGTTFTEPDSYGKGFNEKGGGVYVLEWTSSVINIWFFPRESVPDSLRSDDSYDSSISHPDSSTFGTPSASFAGPCSSSFGDKFFNHTLIFDTAFCGGWAGGSFGSSNGSQCALIEDATPLDSCIDYVAKNPTAFQEAYWEISSLRVWQKVANFDTQFSVDKTTNRTGPPAPAVKVSPLTGGALTDSSKEPFRVPPLGGSLDRESSSLFSKELDLPVVGVAESNEPAAVVSDPSLTVTKIPQALDDDLEVLHFAAKGQLLGVLASINPSPTNTDTSPIPVSVLQDAKNLAPVQDPPIPVLVPGIAVPTGASAASGVPALPPILAVPASPAVAPIDTKDTKDAVGTILNTMDDSTKNELYQVFSPIALQLLQNGGVPVDEILAPEDTAPIEAILPSNETAVTSSKIAPTATLGTGVQRQDSYTAYQPADDEKGDDHQYDSSKSDNSDNESDDESKDEGTDDKGDSKPDTPFYPASALCEYDPNNHPQYESHQSYDSGESDKKPEVGSAEWVKKFIKDYFLFKKLYEKLDPEDRAHLIKELEHFGHEYLSNDNDISWQYDRTEQSDDSPPQRAVDDRTASEVLEDVYKARMRVKRNSSPVTDHKSAQERANANALAFDSESQVGAATTGDRSSVVKLRREDSNNDVDSHGPGHPDHGGGHPPPGPHWKDHRPPPHHPPRKPSWKEVFRRLGHRNAQKLRKFLKLHAQYGGDMPRPGKKQGDYVKYIQGWQRTWSDFPPDIQGEIIDLLAKNVPVPPEHGSWGYGKLTSGSHGKGDYGYGGYDQSKYYSGGYGAEEKKPGGYSSGDYKQGGFPQGGFHPGGFHPGGFHPGGFHPGGPDKHGHDQPWGFQDDHGRGGPHADGNDHSSEDQASPFQGGNNPGGKPPIASDSGAHPPPQNVPSPAHGAPPAKAPSRVRRSKRGLISPIASNSTIPTSKIDDPDEDDIEVEILPLDDSQADQLNNVIDLLSAQLATVLERIFKPKPDIPAHGDENAGPGLAIPGEVHILGPSEHLAEAITPSVSTGGPDSRTVSPNASPSSPLVGQWRKVLNGEKFTPEQSSEVNGPVTGEMVKANMGIW